MNRVLFKIVLAVTSAALTLGIIDTSLRFLSPVAPRSGRLTEKSKPNRLTSRTASFEPHFSTRLIADEFNVEIRTNDLGFRDDDHDPTVLHRNPTIAFVGDSYFFGWGVAADARVGEYLCREIHRAGGNACCINLAFPGWGTFQYFDVIRLYASKLDVKLFVIGLFIGNDFLDDVATREREARAQSGASAEMTVREILRTSPIANRVRTALWARPWFRQAFNALEIRNDRILLYERHEDETQARLYRPTLEALEEIATFARAIGVKVLVVLIPDHLQVLQPKLFDGYDAARPQRVLGRHLASLGVPYLDLLETLPWQSEPQQLYYRQDKHWNERGHAEAAKVVLSFVCKAELGRPLGGACSTAAEAATALE